MNYFKEETQLKINTTVHKLEPAALACDLLTDIAREQERYERVILLHIKNGNANRVEIVVDELNSNIITLCERFYTCHIG